MPSDSTHHPVRRVVRYDVVSGESPRTLAADVEELIAQRWEPWGSMVAHQRDDSATGWWYHQPMVVYADDER
jgi:hypothetical protein